MASKGYNHLQLLPGGLVIDVHMYKAVCWGDVINSLTIQLTPNLLVYFLEKHMLIFPWKFHRDSLNRSWEILHAITLWGNFRQFEKIDIKVFACIRIILLEHCNRKNDNGVNQLHTIICSGLNQGFYRGWCGLNWIFRFFIYFYALKLCGFRYWTPLSSRSVGC